MPTELSASTDRTSIDLPMPDQSTHVFVSYSHADASLVAPIVKLLRVNKSLVFQDIDGIQPGERWRSEIARGLAESHLVVVFWCDHANRSDEVSKEWKAAIEQEKDLLPLLLDATPLPPGLGEFQWIDFRGTVGANHSSIASAANDTSASRPPLNPSSEVPSLAATCRTRSVFGCRWGVKPLHPERSAAFSTTSNAGRTGSDASSCSTASRGIRSAARR